LMVSSMFNAMLRDWRFGVPLMLLVAIAYRDSQEVSSNSHVKLSASASSVDIESGEMSK